METDLPSRVRHNRPPLETSLVEWKPLHRHEKPPPFPALETSLVEWKLQVKSALCAEYFSLGNFLSGMETPIQFDIVDRLINPLETSLVEWKQVTRSWTAAGGMALGNFLSGMETKEREERKANESQPWKLP